MNKYLYAFEKFKPLLKELVVRDVKVRYRKSFLGLLWTLLNPLFMMIIMTIVFSTLFKSAIENFPAYLLSGQVVFNFFNESTNNAMNSIIGNSHLIKKVYVPKYLFPISKILSTLVNLLASIIVLIVVMLVTKVSINWNALFVVIPLIGLLLFSTGMGLLLSAYAVFFRDLLHFYGVLTLAWNYLTPVFYPLDILPDNLIRFVELNPLTNIIHCVRICTLYGRTPSIDLLLMSLIPGMIITVVGLWSFYNKQDRFILYV